MDEVGVPVDLYIYDISKGRHVDGIWHTSIVAYGREYFFGGAGIQSCNPGGTVLGPPEKIEKLGDTFIPYQIFIDYVLGLGETAFRGSEYNLFEHNCNNFSDSLANFLCGGGIPKYILELPHEVLNTPLGQSLRPLIDNLGSGAQNIISANGLRNTRQESPDFLQLNTQIEEARLQSIALEEKRNSINEKIARKERKKEKKKKKLLREQERLNGSSSDQSELSNSGFPPLSPVTKQKSPVMAEAAAVQEVNGAGRFSAEDDDLDSMVACPRQPGDKLPSERALELEQQEREEDEQRKKFRDPPIVFKDFIEAKTAYEQLAEAISGAQLSAEDQQSMAELQQYMVQGEGSWALGDNFLVFIGGLLGNSALGVGAHACVLRALACAALRDDIILLLHQDRREHILMNYAHSIDRLPLDEQKALALLVCNMFENLSSSEWLMYISEWPLGGQQVSNIRVSTKVAVHSLLSEDPQLQDTGSAIIHNLACKEVKTVVFDDVAVEMAMAVLQRLSSAPGEEQLFRCMKALSRFCQVSGQDVPQLIQMIGPHPDTFKGTSPRVDELITAISKKLR